MQAYIPFDRITKIALQDACKKSGVEQSIIDELMPLYFEPTTFDDVLAPLKVLQEKSIQLGILSNGTHQMLQSGISKNGLANLVHYVFSVDDIKVFKPDPKVYAMVTKALKLDASEITFVSSNQWDVVGAANFGFRVLWVNRNNS